MDDKSILNTGLRGVTVASTRISDVDGNRGILIYRGYRVGELAQKSTFEEVAHLLIHEKMPDKHELETFSAVLAENRKLPASVIESLKLMPKTALPMDILQSGTAMLAAHDPAVNGKDRDDFVQMGVRLIARMPTLIAAWHRIRSGLPPVDPSDDLGFAANFLYMLTNGIPDDDAARFFDVALLLHAEHSFNASTFSARQIASTRAHLYASVAGAIGSLSGELHGGANVRVMEMLLDIGEPEAVDAYVREILDRGERIMGLGHAVYKVDDPRAHILAPMSREMGIRTGETKWYDISKLLEQKGKEAFKARKKTEIFVNVDFYSASLYFTMGIPVDLFTPVFAMARTVGWVAHVLEERFAGAAPKPALYRPDSEYVGEYCGRDQCTYIPIDER